MLLDHGASQRARAMRWHGQGSLQRFEERLRSALQSWCQDWGCGPFALRCEAAGPAQEAAWGRWQLLAQSTTGESLAWIGSATGRGAEGLAPSLFGQHPPRATSEASASLADGVAADAWQALRLALAAGLPGAVPAIDDASAPPPDDARPWSGAVRATLTLGGDTWLLHARSPAVDERAEGASIVRPAAANRAGLQPLPKALARHCIALQARLADMPVTLGELLALRAGDVLLTPHRLTDPLSVHAPGPSTPALYAAQLAQRDGHVAVVLASTLASPAKDRLEGIPMNTSATAQLLGLPEAADPASGAAALAAATNPLLGVKTTLQVCVGEAVLSVGELTQARVGQVIKLDREVDGLVDLMLDGRIVARGQLVAVDDCFGIRLTELPQPLTAA